MFRLWPFFSLNPEAAARSEMGPRQENQDNYLIIRGNGEAEYLRDGGAYRQRLDRWPTNHWRLCLVDGMGGHEGGRAFAASAVETLLAEPFGPRALSARREQLQAVHAGLHGRWHQGPESPGGTLTWIDVQPNGAAYLAQVGDSRAFLWREGDWQPLTHDHSPEEFAWRDGDAIETDRAPEHAITQALGYGSFGVVRDGQGVKQVSYSPLLRLDLAEDLPREKRDHADLKQLRLKRGDGLLLASDGLWSGEDKEAWRQFQPQGRGRLHERLRELLWGALRGGASDNLTAVVCLIG